MADELAFSLDQFAGQFLSSDKIRAEIAEGLAPDPELDFFYQSMLWVEWISRPWYMEAWDRLRGRAAPIKPWMPEPGSVLKIRLSPSGWVSDG